MDAINFVVGARGWRQVDSNVLKTLVVSADTQIDAASDTFVQRQNRLVDRMSKMGYENEAYPDFRSALFSTRNDLGALTARVMAARSVPSLGAAFVEGWQPDVGSPRIKKAAKSFDAMLDSNGGQIDKSSPAYTNFRETFGDEYLAAYQETHRLERRGFSAYPLFHELPEGEDTPGAWPDVTLTPVQRMQFANALLLGEAVRDGTIKASY